MIKTMHEAPTHQERRLRVLTLMIAAGVTTVLAISVTSFASGQITQSSTTPVKVTDCATAVAAQDVPPPRSLQLEAAQAVEVEVLGANRKGIPNTSVRLTNGGREVKRGIADSSGCVRFYGEPEGGYRLDISGPGIENPGSVVYVTPGSRWFQFWLPVIDGKAVKMQLTPCPNCNVPHMAAPLLEPIASSVENQLPIVQPAATKYRSMRCLFLWRCSASQP
jgi:hypothetical protein